MALNPAVEFLVSRGLKRGPAVGIVFVGTILVIVGIAATFVPTLVREVNDFANAVPGYIDDLTRAAAGSASSSATTTSSRRRARRSRRAASAASSGSRTRRSALTKSILNAVIAVVTIAFLTLFMLLEGPAWVERIYGLLPEESQPRWRKVGGDIYRTVGGYVTGQPRDQPHRGRHVDGRPPRARRPVRGRARARRRDPRPDPARRRHDRRDHRQRRRLPPLDDGRDRARDLLRPLPAAREPRAAAARLRSHGAAVAVDRARRRADGRRARRA